MEIINKARFNIFFSSTIKALVVNMPLKIPPSLIPNKQAAKLTSNKPLIKFKMLSLLLSLPILINSKIKISFKFLSS